MLVLFAYSLILLSKGSGVKDLVPRWALLGGIRTFKRWGLITGLQVIGGMSLFSYDLLEFSLEVNYKQQKSGLLSFLLLLEMPHLFALEHAPTIAICQPSLVRRPSTELSCHAAMALNIQDGELFLYSSLVWCFVTSQKTK